MMIVLLLLTITSLGRAVPNCMYQVYQNKDCPGNDIKTDLFNDVKECYNVCDVTDNCVAVVWNKETQRCHFKKICDLQSLVTPKLPLDVYAKPPDVYKVQPNTDCFGHDIIGEYKSDVQGCIKKCEETPGCVGFFRDAVQCWLKYTCDTMRSFKGNLYLNPSGQFQYIPNNDCMYNDIVLLTDENPGTCKQACLDTKDCVAVVMDPTNGYCWLKHLCTHIIKATNREIYLVPACVDQLRLGDADEDDEDFGDCGSVGGVCRAVGKCEAGEKPCTPKCGTKIGLGCCCREQCKAEGGTCRNAGQCETDETKCGPCGKGIGKVCCC